MATYSTDAKNAANDSFRDLIDAGSGAGKIRLRDSGDVLLAEAVFSDPCAPNSSGGVLTFTLPIEDASADASGTVSYAELMDSDNNVHLTIPAQQGTSAVSGFIVMNTLSLVAGGPVPIVSLTIG